MANFKIGDKVVAPTVFTGVGVVEDVTENVLCVAVRTEQMGLLWFTQEGHHGLSAELPALHHYKEPSGKLTFLEAMQALAEGKKVYSDANRNVLFTRETNLIYAINYTDSTRKQESTGIYASDCWYIYEEQETIEWIPKKYDSVLVKNALVNTWSLRHFARSVETDFYTIHINGMNSVTVWDKCIPFKDNEHLLGTTDEPNVKYVIKEQKDEQD